MKIDLRNITQQLLAPRRWNIADRRVLAICMGLSLVMWGFVKLSKTYERRSVLALEFKLPLGRTFAELPPQLLPVKLSGTGWKLLTKGPLWRRTRLVFKLDDAQRQVLARPEIVRRIEEQLDLTVLELGQESITLRLDTLFSKQVKVVLDTAINYQNGYAVRDSIVLEPDSVRLFGAANLLNSLSEVRTEPLRMDCPKQDFRKTLRLLNPYPRLVEFSASEAAVFLPVEQFTEKLLTLPVSVTNATDSIRLVPGTVQLRCVVGISRFGQLSPDDFRVVADFGGASTGSNSLPLMVVKQPRWVHSVQISPRAVEYLIVQ